MANYTKVAIAVLLLMLIYLSLVHFNLSTSYDRLVYSQPSNIIKPGSSYGSRFSGFKKILYWNDVAKRKDCGLGVGNNPFKNCPVNTCYATYDRDSFDIMEVDAVIWSPRSKDRSFPSHRSHHTRYIFLMMEPPTHLHQDITSFKDVFNYTMTYRRDSDISMPRCVFKRRKIPLADNKINYAVGKTKMAAWFVSNCKATSARGKLAEKLQEYLSVDIYGRCGTKTCSRKERIGCYEMLGRDYKFYLSFENSLCKGYVTEKLFFFMRYNIIPVVYGLSNYSSYSPPHSFINVLDFKTVKHLADYLTYLSHNDTAYNEYFRWRKNYNIVPPRPMCNLCSKLHSDKQVKTYDIYNWYAENNCINYTSLSLKF